MKKALLFLPFLILAGCAAREVKLSRNPQDTLTAALEAPAAIKEEPVFNGLIDDFEENLSYWHIHGVPASFSRRGEKSGTVGHLGFKLGYSPEEFEGDIAFLRYARRMNFRSYRGIRFMARGSPEILFKIRIREREERLAGQVTDEVWFKPFRAGEEWGEYRIPFGEMQVEEYYEQDYISDNIQVFTNIAMVEISAQNRSRTEAVSGELFLDDIRLYQD